MQVRQVAGVLLGIALASGVTMAVLPAAVAKETRTDIWKDEPKETRPSWSIQRNLSKEQVERIMKGLRQRDPAKAKALNELREKDPNRFMSELRAAGRPELEQMFRERWEARRQDRNNRFLAWLKVNYPAEEQALTKLKEGDPQLYMKAFDNVMNRYGYIFEAEGTSPELGAVLKEDLELRRRLDDLCRRYHAEKSEAKKQAIGSEMEDVVARRYDLIVRRKEIAYEQLLKRVEDLQKQVSASKDDIVKYKDKQIKRENVRQRIEALVGNEAQFKWD